MVTDNVKQITIDRSIIILKALKKYPMTSAEIFRLINPASKIDRAELYHVLTKMTKIGCIEKSYINSTLCKFTYLKDYPQPKVKLKNKSIPKPSPLEIKTVPQSEWMNWQGNLINKPIVNDEPEEPTYKRSKEDIERGIYRAEDRKGRWQVENTARSKNHAVGGSLNGNNFRIIV